MTDLVDTVAKIIDPEAFGLDVHLRESDDPVGAIRRVLEEIESAEPFRPKRSVEDGA